MLLLLLISENMKKLLLLLIFVMSINSVLAQKYTKTYIQDATKVASNWLDNIHNNKYEEAYGLLSKEVKAIYLEENWVTFMRQLMLEFGEIRNREMIKSYFQSEIEGHEDGFYVFIDYNVNYKNTQEHTETLVLKQNDKTKWEIAVFEFKYDDKNHKESPDNNKEIIEK